MEFERGWVQGAGGREPQQAVGWRGLVLAQALGKVRLREFPSLGAFWPPEWLFRISGTSLRWGAVTEPL